MTLADTPRKPFRGRPRRDDNDFHLHPIDVRVGERIREARIFRRMTQDALGEAIGTTFQQVQKYERGFNRVSASRLFEIARALQLPIAFFFDDTDPAHGTGADDGAQDQPAGIVEDVTASVETLDLAKAYWRISDTATRAALMTLARTLGNDAAAPPMEVTAEDPAPPRGADGPDPPDGAAPV